jgi:hypothetical protein
LISICCSSLIDIQFRLYHKPHATNQVRIAYLTMIAILLTLHIIAVNRNNPESRSGAPPVASPITSHRFGTQALAPTPSPSVNDSLSIFYTVSPRAYPNVPSYKTPQQVVADLASVLDIGTFYIVTKGREPGIYTDW